MYEILEHKSTLPGQVWALPGQVWESASLDTDFKQLQRALPTSD